MIMHIIMLMIMFMLMHTLMLTLLLFTYASLICTKFETNWLS